MLSLKERIKMINDNRTFTIDEEFNDLEIDGEMEIITNLPKYIKTYVKQFEIASVGVTIVYNNARQKMSEPSGAGTMRNLYRLFQFYYLLTGETDEN